SRLSYEHQRHGRNQNPQQAFRLSHLISSQQFYDFTVGVTHVLPADSRYRFRATIRYAHSPSGVARKNTSSAATTIRRYIIAPPPGKAINVAIAKYVTGLNSSIIRN